MANTIEKKNVHEFHRSRLRKRLINNPSSLEDHELIELLLFFSIPRKNVNAPAHEIVNAFKNFKDIFHAPVEKLVSLDGIGEKSAKLIAFVGQTLDYMKYCRRKMPIEFKTRNIKIYLTQFFKKQKRECIMAFYLDGQNNVIERKLIESRMGDVFVNPRPLTAGVLAKKSSYVAIARFSPFGEVAKNEVDDLYATRLIRLFDMPNVCVYDYLLVNKTAAFSYRESGRLDELKDRYYNTVYDN